MIVKKCWISFVGSRLNFCLLQIDRENSGSGVIYTNAFKPQKIDILINRHINEKHVIYALLYLSMITIHK